MQLYKQVSIIALVVMAVFCVVSAGHHTYSRVHHPVAYTSTYGHLGYPATNGYWTGHNSLAYSPWTVRNVGLVGGHGYIGNHGLVGSHGYVNGHLNGHGYGWGYPAASHSSLVWVK